MNLSLEVNCMANVKVNVLKIVDMSFPIFVKFELIDCNSVSHYFIDKVPVISDNYDLIPPCTGNMRCSIIRETNNTIIIDTSKPDDIESLNGEYQFEVFKEQVKV